MDVFNGLQLTSLERARRVVDLKNVVAMWVDARNWVVVVVRSNGCRCRCREGEGDGGRGAEIDKDGRGCASAFDHFEGQASDKRIGNWVTESKKIVRYHLDCLK